MRKIDTYHNIGGFIEVDPERVGGAPVLHGHRLTIRQLLVEVIDEGLPIVSKDRDFTKEDIYKASYALQEIAKHLEDPHKLLELFTDKG